MTNVKLAGRLTIVAVVAMSVGAGLFHPGLGLVVFGALCLVGASFVARAPDAPEGER